MSACKECGFTQDRGDGFCTDVCRTFWKRRTTHPDYWTNLPREAKVTGMSEETREKLREYADKKKAVKEAEAKALQADEERAAQEVGF